MPNLTIEEGEEQSLLGRRAIDLVRAALNRWELFMEALDELFCVDDALWLDLIDVCFEHRLKSRSEGLFWELKGR